MGCDVGVCGFIVSQFFGPAKTNPAVDASQSIESRLQLTPQVAAILIALVTIAIQTRRDGHGIQNVAPVSWLVISDVDEARQNMNFSEWGRYTQRDADGLLKRICQKRRPAPCRSVSTRRCIRAQNFPLMM